VNYVIYGLVIPLISFVGEIKDNCEKLKRSKEELAEIDIRQFDFIVWTGYSLQSFQDDNKEKLMVKRNEIIGKIDLYYASIMNASKTT
jgi:co-chaperonin GroES (HSP10)